MDTPASSPFLEKPKDLPRVAKHKVTMGGSQWSVATFGIVEFLRLHNWARMITGFSGIALGVVGVMKLVGIDVPKIGAASPFGLLLFVVPWLLWVATISGANFELVFPSQQAAKERENAEARFNASPTPEDALALDQKRLNEYYVINQSQARSSFRWAIFSMFLGLGTIITGIWVFYFRATPDKFMASLSTAAGLVVNVISGLFLYLHGRTQDRSLYYYQQLAAMQKFSMAIRLVEAHKDTAEQKMARDLIIKELLARANDVEMKIGNRPALEAGPVK
jgi:Cyanobacterial TRADD-N associated 2-Transmembrane domain